MKNSSPENGCHNGHSARTQEARVLSPSRPASRQTTVGEIAKLLGAELVGDAKTLITGVSGLDSTLPGTIAFIEKESLLSTALDSSASAIIAPVSLADKMRLSEGERGARRKPAVLTGNPRLAFAKVMEYLQPLDLPEAGIHPSAVIEADAYVGEGVSIGANCYVGHHAHIADGVVLHAHVVIENGVQIGKASTIDASVVVHHHVHIGARVRIHSGTIIGGDGFGYVLEDGKHHKVPQIGTVIIEDDVEIGANVCIDRAMLGATRIGSGTKIDNLVQIAHNVQVGKNCIICSQVGLSGSVTVGDGVVMAGQVGVRDHIKIGKGAVLGAKCGVMNDIGSGEFVLGSPAVPQRDFFRQEAASRKLPGTTRTLRQLEKQIQQLQERLDTIEKE